MERNLVATGATCSHQGENVSRFGDDISHNFEPWVHVVDNASYVSLFAMELEKLLVHDKISASCLIVFVFQAMYQTL